MKNKRRSSQPHDYFSKPLFITGFAVVVVLGILLVGTNIMGIISSRELQRTVERSTESDNRMMAKIDTLEEKFDAYIYFPPPKTFSLFGRPFPEDPALQKRISELWSRYYMGSRENTYDKLRIAHEHEEVLDYIKNEAVTNGIPSDVAYQMLHEGKLEPNIRSSADAVGPCQFIESTGNHKGLRTARQLDERRSINLCIEAALDHLKNDLFDVAIKYSPSDTTNAWYLALAAYNTGEGNLQEAIEKNGGNADYFSLRPFLHRETADYLIHISILKELVHNHGDYGFSLRPVEPIYSICPYRYRMELSEPVLLRDVVLDTLQFVDDKGNPNYSRFYHCNPHILERDPNRNLAKYSVSPWFDFFLPEPLPRNINVPFPDSINENLLPSIFQ